MNEKVRGIPITSVILDIGGKPVLIPIKNVVDIDTETNTVTVITNTGLAAMEDEEDG